MIFPSVIVKTIGPIFQNSELFLHSKENKNGSLLLDTLYLVQNNLQVNGA